MQTTKETDVDQVIAAATDSWIPFIRGTAQERRARINGAVPATFEGPGCT